LRNITTIFGNIALRCTESQTSNKEFWGYLMAHKLIRWLVAEASLRATVRARKER